MKNILLPVHDDFGQEARLQTALDLTRALEGHLHCVDLTPAPVVVDSGWGAPVVVLDEADQESRNGARIRQRLAAEDVSWSWKDVRGDLGPALVAEAATADVVVINRKLEGLKWPAVRVIAGDVLTKIEALVLAVEPSDKRLDFSAPAVIAWDGSATAMRAVQRAAPMLKLAGTVRICQVGDLDEAGIDAREAATYLSRHGVKPEIEIAPRAEDPVQRVLLTVERLGAGYCAMGGYGHSRIREAIFGGFTREMLDRAGVPLVIGH